MKDYQTTVKYTFRSEHSFFPPTLELSPDSSFYLEYVSENDNGYTHIEGQYRLREDSVFFVVRDCGDLVVEYDSLRDMNAIQLSTNEPQDDIFFQTLKEMCDTLGVYAILPLRSDLQDTIWKVLYASKPSITEEAKSDSAVILWRYYNRFNMGFGEFGNHIYASPHVDLRRAQSSGVIVNYQGHQISCKDEVELVGRINRDGSIDIKSNESKLTGIYQ